MALKKILTVTGTAVNVPGNDIDTDRIIPARFMKCVTFNDLGQYTFYDERFTSEGKKKSHPLNEPQHQGASILITGSNFGCGSSREHAPQALYRYGFRAILAESYAEIFFGNSTTLGMPCLSFSRDSLQELAQLADTNPSLQFVIDIESCRVTAGDKIFQGNLPRHAQDILIQGKWDPIGELLEGIPAVRETAESLPYFS